MLSREQEEDESRVGMCLSGGAKRGVKLGFEL